MVDEWGELPLTLPAESGPGWASTWVVSHDICRPASDFLHCSLVPSLACNLQFIYIDCPIGLHAVQTLLFVPLQ